MSYTPTEWKDRVVEKPRTFNMQQNPDGTITLIPAPGTVVQEGTPVNAANLNKIEQGFVSHLAESMQLRTWEKISEIAIPQDVAQLNFEDVSEYRNFRLLVQGNTTGDVNGTLLLQFNDDSTQGNYISSLNNNASSIQIVGALVPINRGKGLIEVFISNIIAEVSMVFADGAYSNSDTGVSRLPTTAAGKWKSTDKIEKINLSLDNYLISEESIFILWGVK